MSIPNDSPQSGNAVKDFQLTSDVQSKSDFAFGLRIARYIQSTLGGNTSYYFLRNSRFAKNRSMIAGRYDMSRFMDRLQLNGKFNYININWLPFHIVNTIVSRKVGSWMLRNEKVNVEAIDVDSVSKKKERMMEVEFYLANKEQIAALEMASGMQVAPKENMPQDRDELDIWAQEHNQLPEEIKYESGTNAIMSQEGLFDVIKEKLLHDSTGVGLVGIYTWMDEKGEVHNEYVKSENSIYSYSEFPDFRDTTWRGRIVSRKISEVRKKYGQEFGGKLTEQQVFELAQTAKEYQVPDKIRWLSEWSYSLLRPYDEWNIDVIEFAFKSLDSSGFKMKVTQSGTLIMDKANKPFEKQEKKEYIEDDGWNMYWGVYAREKDMMLEWGLMKNQIKAQDIKEIGNVEFPFSFYMYQNQDMRNLAIPEKVEKPFEQMMLVLLKMEQLISKLRPIGAKVNVNAVRELDLGLGDMVKPLEVEKIYDQTGTLYYTDRDAEGNLIGDPITELANAGFAQQAEGLIRMYHFWYQTLKDELGEDPNLNIQAAQPRVTADNVQTSLQQGDNATNYMYDAYLRVMEDAARKTACLLHDSVSFGAKTYRHIIGEEEVGGRVFATKVKMLPTEVEIAKLEQQINQAIASNPDLVMYLNTFKILRIAKEDIKLAEQFFQLGMKRMLQSKLQQQRENQDATFKAQVESGIAAEQEKRKTKQEEGDVEIKKAQMTAQAQNQTAVLNMVAGWLKPGAEGKVGSVPTEYQPLVRAVMENVALGAFIQTEEQKQKIISEMQAAREQHIAQQQPQPVEAPQQIQQQV